MQGQEQLIVEKLNALSDDEYAKVEIFIDNILRNRNQPKTLFEKIDELWADVPEEVWAKIPTDGAEQHDHYIYGIPKK